MFQKPVLLTRFYMYGYSKITSYDSAFLWQSTSSRPLWAQNDTWKKNYQESHRFQNQFLIDQTEFFQYIKITRFSLFFCFCFLQVVEKQHLSMPFPMLVLFMPLLELAAKVNWNPAAVIQKSGGDPRTKKETLIGEDVVTTSILELNLPRTLWMLRKEK